MKVEMEATNIKQYLYSLMLSKGLSHQDLAPQLGMDMNECHHIINGKSLPIKWIIPIAEWCKLTPLQLWDLLKQEETPKND